MIRLAAVATFAAAGVVVLRRRRRRSANVRVAEMNQLLADYPPLLDHVLADLPPGVKVILHTADLSRVADQTNGHWPRQPTVTHETYWTAPRGGKQIVPVRNQDGMIVDWVPADE